MKNLTILLLSMGVLLTTYYKPEIFRIYNDNAGIQDSSASNIQNSSFGSGICSDTGFTFDRDIKRNFDQIKSAGICVNEVEINDVYVKWRIQILSNGQKDPLLVLLHDDENTAFDSAIYALSKYGGQAISIHSQIGTKEGIVPDPNRNFVVSMDEAQQCGNQQTDLPNEYSAWFSERIKGKTVIALHNNENGTFINGGKGNFALGYNSSRYLSLSAINKDGRLSDFDNVVLVSGLAKYQSLPKERLHLIKELRLKGVNVIYERVKLNTYDCSLSNYSILNKKGKVKYYFNIEAEQNDYSSQKQMVDILWEILIKQGAI